MITIIGKYLNSNIMYDDDSSKSDLLSVLKGPIKDENYNKQYRGLVYRDNKTGQCTQEDGSPYVYVPLKYEIKTYVVGTSDLEYAIKLIDNYINHEDRRVLR